MKKRIFPSSLDHLYEMLFFIKYSARLAGFDVRDLNQIELASEEALVNIVSYAYPEQGGVIEISCINHRKKRGISIILKDRGVAYNPLKNLTIYIPNPSESHGRGIHLIVEAMDNVRYHRYKKVNVLKLSKFLDEKASDGTMR